MKTGIEITHNRQETGTSLYDIFRESFASDVGIRFANFNHGQALLTFNYEIGKNQRTKIIQKKTGSIPSIYGSFIRSFAGISISLFFVSTEYIVNPVSQAFVCACDCKFAMPLRPVSVSSLFHLSKVKTTLAIDYACYVGKLSFGLILGKWNQLSHIISFVYGRWIINEQVIKCHRERLSEKAQKWDAIV